MLSRLSANDSVVALSQRDSLEMLSEAVGRWALALPALRSLGKAHPPARVGVSHGTHHSGFS